MFFCTGVGRKNVLFVDDVKSWGSWNMRANISVFLVVIIEKILEDS